MKCAWPMRREKGCKRSLVGRFCRFMENSERNSLLFRSQGRLIFSCPVNVCFSVKKEEFLKLFKILLTRNNRDGYDYSKIAGDKNAAECGKRALSKISHGGVYLY